ncbi:MAG: phenylalanine--tRNA ligase subunit beta [Ginsengibacter sp.]
MKISYEWLKEYLPKEGTGLKIIENPNKIGDILTSVGLEVEGIETFEEVKNGLEGLVTGEVLTCEKHPDADRLKITTVDVGLEEPLKIVCGANNVAVGQKVIVATPGATLFPFTGDSFTIKKSKIRGQESNGMLCAEDEIGLGSSHAGIIELPEDTAVGLQAKDYYNLYQDYTFEIGLTPNRMDAMSHLGVAKDVCAYLSHHLKKDCKVISPFKNNFKPDAHSGNISVEVEDSTICPRYSGLSMSGIQIAPSPKWLQDKLKSIGLKPLNNIVDITNFILHETGQPLHAFDADKIKGNKVIVKTLPQDTPFLTLDHKERKLGAEDIIICDGESEPMCIAGVYGGADSGVSENTTSIFLESAVFNPAMIRKTLLRHNLRTDAAIRFEKGIDISNTVNVLKRAAMLIKEVAGGKIVSDIIDIYPNPKEKTEVTLTNHYLKKISGKNYHPDTVKNILRSLNFSISREGIDDIQVAVPFSNPDISLPADIIEEIMRIDGLDNIEIPANISMSPAIDFGLENARKKEKIITWLNGNGFAEIFTNSITNSKYFNEQTLAHSLKIINSISEDLNVMRPSMLPTGLEVVVHNINRKNANLLFLEFGKTYSKNENGFYEKEHLALFFTGNTSELNWNSPAKKIDLYFVKGICNAIFSLMGLENIQFKNEINDQIVEGFSAILNKKEMGFGGRVSKKELEKFAIKQPVYFVSLDWDKILSLTSKNKLVYESVAKFPSMERDLAIVVDKSATYQSIEDLIKSLRLNKLSKLQLFDVFESDKLGENKKSLAISITFSDKEKTLTDKEVDMMMANIINALESQLNASIRRNA